MEIDAYSLCPCQSGNKVKFCCGKEVINDLKGIISNFESRQTQAALDQIDRTIKRSGPKDCLLVLKTHILISAQKLEEAEAVNREFLKNSPHSTSGLQQQAMLQLAKDDIQGGIDILQTAVDSVKGAEIPIMLANTYRLLALMLAETNQIIAAIAHAKFAAELKSQGEDAGLYVDLLEKITAYSSPLLSQHFQAAPLPDESVPWAKLYINVNRAIHRGQFRKALQLLTKIESDDPGQQVVLEGLAIVKSMLARPDSANAWRAYADVEGLGLARRAEAIAIADLIDAREQGTVNRLLVTFELADFSSATEQLLSSKQVVSAPVPKDVQVSPPPRFMFALLDQDLPSAEEVQSVDDLPRRIGVAYAFGRQTDREARLEIGCLESDLPQVVTLIETVTGDAANQTNSVPTSSFSQQDALLSQSLQFPEGTTQEQYETLSEEFFDKLMFEQWPNLPWSEEDSRTLLEVAKDSDQAAAVYARIFRIAFNGQADFLDDERKQKLIDLFSLPPLPQLNEEVQHHHRILSSPVLASCLDLEKLSSQELTFMSDQQLDLGLVKLGCDGVRELVNRQDPDFPLDMELLQKAGQVAEHPGEAKEWLDRSIQLANEAGERIAAGLATVCKIDRCLEFGDFDGAQETMKETRQYQGVEVVEYALIRTLDRWGLLDVGSQGQDQVQQSFETAPNLAAEPIIGAASPPAAAPEKSNKLWLPD